MDQIGHEQHPDVSSEVGQRVGQGLAVLATLGEAAARLAAEEMRRRERRAEQRAAEDQQREETTRRLREHSDRLAQHAARQRALHDRQVIAQAADPDWLARADLLDLARVWRTARVREHEFPNARGAAEAVEERLRQMYPRPMDLYDEAVRAGTPRAEAMRTAAAEMARTPVMRPHGGGRAAALETGPDNPMGEAAFAAALSDEQIQLATGVDPAAYAQELARLGPGGDAAQALRDALAARAGREMTQGRADAAIPNDPATASVNEHTAVGMPRNARDTADANRDAATAGTRTAAQLAGEWYPDGMHHPTAPPAQVAGKRPANATPTQTPTRAAGRSR
jgi:hypothetical protein